jgi:hypothetical protein
MHRPASGSSTPPTPLLPVLHLNLSLISLTSRSATRPPTHLPPIPTRPRALPPTRAPHQLPRPLRSAATVCRHSPHPTSRAAFVASRSCAGETRANLQCFPLLLHVRICSHCACVYLTCSLVRRSAGPGAGAGAGGMTSSRHPSSVARVFDAGAGRALGGAGGPAGKLCTPSHPHPLTRVAHPHPLAHPKRCESRSHRIIESSATSSSSRGRWLIWVTRLPRAPGARPLR